MTSYRARLFVRGRTLLETPLPSQDPKPCRSTYITSLRAWWCYGTSRFLGMSVSDSRQSPPERTVWIRFEKFALMEMFAVLGWRRTLGAPRRTGLETPTEPVPQPVSQVPSTTSVKLTCSPVLGFPLDMCLLVTVFVVAAGSNELERAGPSFRPARKGTTCPQAYSRGKGKSATRSFRRRDGPVTVP